MKLTVNRKALADAIARTCQAAEPWRLPRYPNPPWKDGTPESMITPEMREAYQRKIDAWGAEVAKARPIYTKLLLSAGETCTIQGQDKESILSLSVPLCRVHRPGQAMIRPERIGRLLDTLDELDIDIHQAGSDLVFCGNHSEFRDEAGSPSEFIQPTPIKEDATCHIQASDFLRQCELVAGAAASSSAGRFGALHGVQICLGDPLTVFATNGNRMAYSEAPATFQGKPLSPIVTKDALRCVFALLGPKPTDTLVIVADGSHVEFRYGADRVLTCQLQGAFPKWRNVVSKDHKGHVMVTAGDLLSCVRQTGIMQPDTPQTIEVKFLPTMIEFRAQSQIGRALARLPCIGDKEHTTKINGKDLVAALTKLPTDASLTLRYKDKRQTLLVDFGRELQFSSAEMVRKGA